MKISKYTGSDMRQALRMVREQLGADAVILSSRRVLHRSGSHRRHRLRRHAAHTRRGNGGRSPRRLRWRGVREAFRRSDREDCDRSAGRSRRSRLLRCSVAAPLPVLNAAEGGGDRVNEELRTLRRILETQVAQLAWNDLTRRAPIHTEVLRELTQIGLSQEFASQIVAQLPTRIDLTQARRLAIASVSQRIPVTGDRWLENGGRVALIGPTGVGKTTTLTKLAVRWVLRHGPRDVALISADTIRIGAHDTIHALGQMLGVTVHAADRLSDLPALLAGMTNYRFVLIDTPGLSQRDAQLGERLAELSAVGSELETALVLAASTQAGAIEEIIARFAAANPASCLLTKVDEAASLGGVLSALTNAQLPISYISEGQRVPEDLRPARALELITSAVQLSQLSGATADEDLLRRRFGEVAHALA